MKTILVAKVNLLHITIVSKINSGVKKNLLNSLVKQMVRHYLEFIQSKERKKIFSCSLPKLMFCHVFYCWKTDLYVHKELQVTFFPRNKCELDHQTAYSREKSKVEPHQYLFQEMSISDLLPERRLNSTYILQ